LASLFAKFKVDKVTVSIINPELGGDPQKPTPAAVAYVAESSWTTPDLVGVLDVKNHHVFNAIDRRMLSYPYLPVSSRTDP
jgi:hypothetical protein